MSCKCGCDARAKVAKQWRATEGLMLVLRAQAQKQDLRNRVVPAEQPVKA